MMQTVNIPELIILGLLIGLGVGLFRKKALKLNLRMNTGTIGFFVGGVVFGITGSFGGEITLINRLLTTAGAVSAVSLGWDYVLSKQTGK